MDDIARACACFLYALQHYYSNELFLLDDQLIFFSDMTVMYYVWLLSSYLHYSRVALHRECQMDKSNTNTVYISLIIDYFC